MVLVKTFVSVWHPTLKTNKIVAKIPLEPIITANKGDNRGKSGAKFAETYCRFKGREIELESESELVGSILSFLEPLQSFSEFVASGGRVWVTVKIPEEMYELSLSPEEMKKLGAHAIGLSFDVAPSAD